MATSADNMTTSLSLSNFGQATELRKRIWFTLGALIVFRFLSFVPLPGVDPVALQQFFAQSRGGVLDFFNMFSGGSLERMSLIALGVMPYITASIVVQLATSISPTLGALKKEGESGRKKLNQYTRFGTVGLTIVQGFFMIALPLEQMGRGATSGVVAVGDPGWLFRIACVAGLATAYR
jgi:preprotein translocase subunit SecY